MNRLSLNPSVGDPYVNKLHRDEALAIKELQAPPVLRVGRDTSQTLTPATLTVVQFNVTHIDTHGWWDGTNYRYTPKEAGYYRVTTQVAIKMDTTASDFYAYIHLYKNGALYNLRFLHHDPSTGYAQSLAIADVAYMNGATDYMDVRVLLPAAVGGTWNVQNFANRTFLLAEFLGAPAIR